MAAITMTAENFQQTIDNNDVVLIDFWAGWCGPCRAFGPVFEKASEKHPGVVFAKVDTEAQEELAASFGIRSIPTLAAFREKVLLFMQPGALPGDALDQLIGKLQELDMNEVRAEIAEHEKQHGHGHDHEHCQGCGGH